MIAAKNGRTAAIQLLADLRADVHKPRPDGVRPLHLAAKNGHFDPAKILLQLRADVDAQNDRGVSACWVAAGRGHDGVLQLLIRARASFIADSGGATPVWIATMPTVSVVCAISESVHVSSSTKTVCLLYTTDAADE